MGAIKSYVISYEVLNVEEVVQGTAGENLLSSIQNLLPDNVLEGINWQQQSIEARSRINSSSGNATDVKANITD